MLKWCLDELVQKIKNYFQEARTNNYVDFIIDADLNRLLKIELQELFDKVAEQAEAAVLESMEETYVNAIGSIRQY